MNHLWKKSIRDGQQSQGNSTFRYQLWGDGGDMHTGECIAGFGS